MYSFFSSKRLLNFTGRVFVLFLFCFAISKQNYAQEWTKQNPPLSGSNLLSIDGFKDSTIIAVGENGSLIKSSDWGNNWSEVKVIHEVLSIKKIRFIGVNKALASCTNNIIKTTNGGINWDFNFYSGSVISICPLDSLNIFLFCQLATVYKTTDGGETWNKIFLDYSISLKSGCFSDYSTGWMCGSKGLILKTTDGGLSWNKQSSGTANNINSIKFRDSKNGYAVGGNGLILQTTDGGGELGKTKGHNFRRTG